MFITLLIENHSILFTLLIANYSESFTFLILNSIFLQNYKHKKREAGTLI